VARSTANNNQNLDDYDPFSSQPTTTAQPATLQTSNQTLPAYSPTGQQYQVNDATTNSAGSGVTQISTAELQVSHQKNPLPVISFCCDVSRKCSGILISFVVENLFSRIQNRVGIKGKKWISSQIARPTHQ
jgi:hypothetical protein